MHRKSLFHRGVCAILAVLAACQDVPTIVTTVTRRPAENREASTGLHTGQVQFFCVLGRSAPSTASGWQTRVDTLFLPRAEVDEGGRKVIFQFWQPGVEGGMQSGAHCVIPYTEAALRRMDRYFGVQKNGAADQFRARQGMITPQGCVTDGMCVLDPVVVVAPPPEPTDLPPCSGCDAPFPGSRPGGGDGGTGGGGGAGPASPYEEGPLAWVACIGAGLTALGGGVLSYVTVEQYYMALKAYGSAKLRYEFATTVPERSQYYGEMLDAERNVNLMTVAIAGSAAVGVGGLLGVVALCSPSVLFPTP